MRLKFFNALIILGLFLSLTAQSQVLATSNTLPTTGTKTSDPKQTKTQIC